MTLEPDYLYRQSPCSPRGKLENAPERTPGQQPLIRLEHNLFHLCTVCRPTDVFYWISTLSSPSCSNTAPTPFSLASIHR